MFIYVVLFTFENLFKIFKVISKELEVKETN